MKVAVTGGTGCLGHPVLKKLINRGFDISLLTLPEDPAIQMLERNIRVTAGDLHSAKALDLFTKDCNIVFHLAGKVHSVPKTEKDEQSFYQVNVEGTKNLLEAARRSGVKRVVFYSTVGVYGKDSDFHGDERSSCQPGSVYAMSKYSAEELVLDSSKNGGPHGTVLRFPVVYGPLDRGNVAALIKAIYHKHFFYFGDGKCLRSMISSKNAAESAFKAAFESRAADDVFCVTDGQDYTLHDLVETICQTLNTSWRPFHMPLSMAGWLGKCGDVLERLHIPFPLNLDKVRKLSSSLTFSCQKAKRVLGYEPVETLAEGIAKEVKWLKLTSESFK